MRKLRVKLSVIGLLATFSAYAQTPGQALSAILGKINSFQANFVQTIKDANGENVMKTKGEVIIQRPGKFYWKSFHPDPTLVVADGKTLWSYDIDLSQVTKQPLSHALGKSPAALLAGDVSQLNKDFAITQEKTTNCAKGSDLCYKLKPNQKDATFANIIINFKNNILTEVRMKDPLGQDVRTVFSNMQNNKKIPAQRFIFKTPHGVDVIDGGK